MKHADILIWCARKNFPAPLKIEQILSHSKKMLCQPSSTLVPINESGKNKDSGRRGMSSAQDMVARLTTFFLTTVFVQNTTAGRLLVKRQYNYINEQLLPFNH